MGSTIRAVVRVIATGLAAFGFGLSEAEIVAVVGAVEVAIRLIQWAIVKFGAPAA